MTAPTIVAVGPDATGTSDATGVSLSPPAGTVEGDDLWAVVAFARNSNTPTITPPVGGGWGLKKDGAGDNGVSFGRIGIYNKLAGAAEVAGLWTGNGTDTQGACGKMFKIAGAHGVTPLNGTPTGNGGTDATAECLGITTDSDECLLLGAAMARLADIVTFTHPDGMDDRGDFGTDPGSATSLSIASLALPTAGPTGDKVFTISATPTIWASVMVAIAPAVVGGLWRARRTLLDVG